MRNKFNSIVLFLLSVNLQTSLWGQSNDLWEEYRIPMYSSKYALMDFQDSLHGCICTSDARFIITNDGGRSWSKDSIPDIHGRARYLKMTGEAKGWIFTGDDAGKNVTGYYRDKDHLWKKKIEADTTNVEIERGVAIVNDSSLIYVTTKVTGPNTSIRSINRVFNYGATIEVSDFDLSAARGMYTSTVFEDDQNGWITLGGGSSGSSIARTKDGGQTWTWERLNDYNIISDKRKFFSSKIGNTIQTLYVPDFYYYQSLFTIDGGASFVAGVRFLLMDGIYYDTSNYVFLSYGDRFVKNTSDADFSLKPYSNTDSSHSATALVLESTDPKSVWVLTDDNRLFKRKSIVTSVREDYQPKNLADNFFLSNNYPNPFNPSTTISFSLPTKSWVTLKIFDVMGRDVATIVSNDLPAGMYERQWNASGMPSGMYFYRLQAGAFAETKRLALVK